MPRLACATLQTVCVTVCPLALHSPGMSVFFVLCVCACICSTEHNLESARHFIAHFNARPPKPFPLSLPDIGAWWRAVNLPLLCLLFARQLIIEPASPWAAQQSIINPFSQQTSLVSMLYKRGNIKPNNTVEVG